MLLTAGLDILPGHRAGLVQGISECLCGLFWDGLGFPVMKRLANIGGEEVPQLRRSRLETVEEFGLAEGLASLRSTICTSMGPIKRRDDRSSL